MDFVALPKIELHAHLTGSISRRVLHEIWHRKKEIGETLLDDPLTVMPQDKYDFSVESFFPLFSSYIYNLLTDECSIRYATASVLEHFLADGVVYLELRTTPRATAHLSAEAYVRLLLDTIAAFEVGHAESMHTRLVLSIDRRQTLESAEATLELATRLRIEGHGVVGLDLCGDPSARPGGEVALFTPVFEKASSEGLGVTVHFAEAKASSSREELKTLLGWNPGRLGHVIWKDDESKMEIAQRGLCLELCLSCNVQAGMTDDVGVFGSPLSEEYRLVARYFNVNRTQLCNLARQGIDAIFGGEEEKQRLRDIMWS
ncbi:adenosine/AMP deaminase domain-containing protein [Penicillium samsonianum]|uniref:adenosine/AMP deaminase domain-containing protein n=1 Tax=Penicillium samsonianum TaxID=1882272 RepID=UPI0025482603|nr:adenosine/AMP deaminase domain-containing protein [Penicillium samsonianum]KAJ6118396.1 adenosine/AMP deaminase domain-containing protein [Penicillium samsonianum]